MRSFPRPIIWWKAYKQPLDLVALEVPVRMTGRHREAIKELTVGMVGVHNNYTYIYIYVYYTPLFNFIILLHRMHSSLGIPNVFPYPCGHS